MLLDLVLGLILPMSRPLLEIHGLVKAFGRVEVLHGVDLEVPAGSVCGFVGLNGAGKTTTIECALGLLRGFRGRLSILGARPSRVPTLRGRLGVVYDSTCLRPNLTVRQTLEHARLLAGRGARVASDVEELLGIARFRDLKTRKLSLGNRRRTSIAAALVSRPELVVLDEPFSGLDAGGVDDVLDLIDGLNRDDGTTFLLSSHRLEQVERVSTRLCVLHAGRTVLAASIDELLADRRPRLRWRVDDAGLAVSVLETISGIARVERMRADDADTAVVECDLVDADPAAVNRHLVESGVAVSELRRDRPSLAALFRELTQEAGPRAASPSSTSRGEGAA